MRIRNRGITSSEFLIARPEHGPDGEITGNRRHRNCELKGSFFTLLCEADGLCGWSSRPAFRKNQADISVDGSGILIFDVDGEFFFAESLERNDRNVGR